MDEIPQSKNVLFVGEFFTLLTTVQLDEKLRTEQDETEDDFAIRLASMWLGEYYGWDVLGASKEVGIVE
jgi:hypothetical protein